MAGFTIYTETLTRRAYYVEGNTREQAEEHFNENGGDLCGEEIIQESIKSILEEK